MNDTGKPIAAADDNGRDRAVRRPSRLVLVLFPLAVWLLATLSLGGQIGKYSDDFGQHLVSSATGEGNAVVWPWELNTFWRPLFRSAVLTINGVFFEHYWIAHVIAAAAHGLTAWLLLKLILTLGICRSAAWAASILYLCAPIHFESALWVSAITTPMGQIALLLTLLAYANWARRERTLWWSPLFVLAGLAIGSCNEQPTAVVPLMGLVLLAVAPGVQPTSGTVGRTLGRTLVRIVVPTFFAGVGVLTYAALYRETAGDGARGVGQLTPIAEIPGRYLEVTRDALDMLAGGFVDKMMLPAFELGWQTLATPAGIAALLALPVLALGWSRAVASSKQIEGDAVQRSTGFVSGLCIAFGVLWFFMLWAPIAVVQQQSVAPRLVSGGVMAAALVLAGALHPLVRTRPRAGAVALWLAALGAIVGSIAMTGFQARYQRQYQHDIAQAAELAERLAGVPEGTMILPLRNPTTAADSGQPLFDIGLQSGWGPVGRRALMAWAFERDDLVGLAFNRWGPILLDRITAEDASFPLPMPFRLEPHPSGLGGRVLWERMAAFEVDDEGRLWLNPVIFVEQPDHRDLRIELPVVRAALQEQWSRNRPISITPRDSEPIGTAIDRWAFSSDGVERGKPAEFVPSWAWGMRHDAVWLSPRDDRGTRRTLIATIPPSDEPTVLALRATYVEWLQNERRWGDGVDVLVFVDDDGGDQAGTPSSEPRARLELRPTLIDLQRRWIPIRVTLPPSQGSRTLRIEADPGPSGNRDWDRVWISQPRLLPAN